MSNLWQCIGPLVSSLTFVFFSSVYFITSDTLCIEITALAVLGGIDPSVNVILLEDLAAVLGVAIAAGCLGITYYTGSPMADAVGSLLIGSLLGGVASFIVYTNAVSLVGRLDFVLILSENHNVHLHKNHNYCPLKELCDLS